MLLKLNGLAVDCIIGEREYERTASQRLSLDLELEVSDAVAQSDELSDTVDYAELAGRIRSALVSARCRMIECAARVAVDVCMECGCVRRAVASVTKFGAVAGLASATAVYERRK